MKLVKNFSLIILLVLSGISGATNSFAQHDSHLLLNTPIASTNSVSNTSVISTDNLFEAELPVDEKAKDFIVIKGTLRNRDTGEPVAAKIVYERLPTGVTVGITKSREETGEYKIALPRGHVYGYRAEIDGFLPIGNNIDLTGDATHEKEIIMEMLIVPIKVGASVDLNNIFFDFDKSSLKAESYPELKRVTKFLAENKDIEIGLAGHTDAIGTGIYNMKLAERRSRAVAKYLIKNNTSKKRIEVQYYGKIRPASTNETDDGRQKNRRVEFIILEK